MSDTDNAIVTLDGFLDDETVPGDNRTTTARFRLTISPTDDTIEETMLPCAVTDANLAISVLTELVPGDELRVTGYLRLPPPPTNGCACTSSPSKSSPRSPKPQQAR